MDSFQEIWSCVLQKIHDSGEFIEPTYNLWFRDLELENLTKTQAVVKVNTAYKAEIIGDRYLKILEDALAEVLGFHLQISLNIVLDEPTYIKEKITLLETEFSEPEIRQENEESGPIYLKYNPEYTFDNFIVGNTNKFAHAACKAIAKDPNHFYNPLFIHGASGLGKTHLLYAITNDILLRRPDANVVYVRGEDFTNELIRSLSKKMPMQYFRDRYRKADVLLVDDIQFIAGKPSTQEEFFHTFNALYDEKKQIILASDRPPKEIQNLEDRLESRFSWGLVVDVQPPDLELRVAILKSKAELMEVDIPDMVITFLADNIKNNIRQLEGAVKRLKALTYLNNTKVTMPVAKEALKDFFSEQVPVGVTIDQIFEIIAKHYNVPVNEIRGKKRLKDISTARHVTIFILRSITELSLNDIGRYFDMHHTSVLSACNNINESMKSDPKLEFEISSLIREIRNGM